MNILFITQEDYLAGSTYSVSYLAIGLARKGHRVYVGARPDSLLESLVKDSIAGFFPITISSRFDWQATKSLAAFVRQNNIQIINAQSSKDRYIAVWVKWFFNRRLKVVHTRRQISLSMGGWAQNLVYVGGTEKIVAVSNQVKESLVRQKFPAQHIKVILNGTPAEKYSKVDLAKTEQLRSKFGIRPGDVVIGCVSRKKNPDQLIGALDYFEKPVTLIFVGTMESEDLMEQVKNLKLNHKVFFEGYVNSGEALNYYPLFDVHVLCSTSEGLSQCLLESMYMKIPVVATGAGGNIDLINDSENGLLFEDKDSNGIAESIQRILGDNAFRAKLIANGHQTASQEYSIEKTVNNYEAFFEELISHKGPTSTTRIASVTEA